MAEWMRIILLPINLKEMAANASSSLPPVNLKDVAANASPSILPINRNLTSHL